MFNQKFKSFALSIAKIGIATLAFYFIYQKISKEDLSKFLTFFEIFNFGHILIFTLLAFSNWFFEILKWQKLSSFVKPISFQKSAEIVFTSFAVSIITPNRVGEYGSKVAFYGRENWKRILSLNLFGNLSQMQTTLAFACIAAIFIPVEANEFIDYTGRALIFIAFAFVSVALYSKILMPWIISKFTENNVWAELGLANKLQVFVFSILRYISFASMFLYFLFLIEGNFKLDYIFMLGVYYAVVSVMPSIVIADIAIRGSIGILLFKLVGVHEINLLAVVFFSWLFNFALQTAIGSIYLIFSPTKKVS